MSDSRVAAALQRAAKSTKTISGLIGEEEQQLIHLGLQNPTALTEVLPEHIRINLAAKVHSMATAVTTMAAKVTDMLKILEGTEGEAPRTPEAKTPPPMKSEHHATIQLAPPCEAGDRANWDKYVAVHGDEALFKGDIQELCAKLNEAASDPQSASAGAAQLPAKLTVPAELERALIASCRTGRPMPPGALYAFHMPWRRAMKLLLQLDTSNAISGEDHLAVLVYLLTLWDSSQCDWTFAFVRLPAQMPGYQQLYMRASSIRSQTMLGDGSTRPGGPSGGTPKGRGADDSSSWKTSSWAAHGGSGSNTWKK
jgi:hypothetical protein